MLGSGFVSKIPKNAATSSGLQNYDNVLVDAHANERLLIGGGILQLRDPHNAAKGEVGLSDHYPVFVEMCEVQKTGKPTPEPLPEVHRQAYEEEPSVEEREALALIAPPVIVQADAVEPPLETVEEEEQDATEQEATEQAVREVVSAAMEQVAQSVVAAAATENGAEAELTSAEAPSATVESTEAPHSTPSPPPEPARASPPETAPSPPPPPAGETEAEPQPQPEPEPGSLEDELEASRLEWEQEDELARDLPEDVD